MADGRASLLVTIKKFSKSLHIKNISSSKISAGYRNLAILEHNGCLFIRNVESEDEKTLQNITGFEWGCPVSTKDDEACHGASSDDYLCIIKDDFALELYHVHEKMADDLEEQKFTVSCIVEVSKDLLKGLLRDRGKVAGDYSIHDISIIAMETERNPTNHVATLLVNQKYIVLLSLSVNVFEVVYCFALDNSTLSLPVVVPVSSLVQVKRCQSLIFCLFSSGTTIIHLISGEFIGVIDIQSYHFKSDDTDSYEDSFDTHYPTKFVNLEITEDLSVLISSDESNTIYTINLDDYFQDNPSNLCFKNRMTKSAAKLSQQGTLQYSTEDEDLLLRSAKMSDIGYGDRFWKNELVEMRLETAQDRSVDVLPNGRWFNHIKEIQFSIPAQRCQDEKLAKSTKLSGFLLKRRKSDARSATPGSDSSISISKEPIMSQSSCTEVKSLIYNVDMFVKEQELVKMSAGFDSFLVQFKPKNCDSSQDVGPNYTNGLLYLYGYSNTDVAYHMIFSEPAVIVQSSDSLQPVCVLTKKQLTVPSFGINQNQFVHKVIMYENAALAEEVCRVNQWDHCVIPLEALKVALKHRQLNTIAFFLKTQENVFTSSTESVTSPRTTLSPQQSFSSSPAFQNTPVRMDTKQTEDVINALVSSVKKNAKQHHNLQFTNQLLQLTLKYLHCLLQDGTQFIEMKRIETPALQDSEPVLLTQVENCLMFVTKSVDELRHYLSNLSEDDGIDVIDGDDSSGVFCNIGDESWDVMGKWITMDDKDVIKDAIINSTIGTAQAYFMTKLNTKVSCDGSLSALTATGLEIMLSCLVNQDVDTAMKIITNLGRDVMDQLRVLCFNTFHRPLRDFLICELRSRGQLTSDDEDMIEFVHSLETVYGTQSYNIAKKTMKSPPDNWTEFGLLRNTFSLDSARILEMNIETGSLLQGPLQYENQHGGYAEVLLDWVKAWSPEDRQRILFERILCEKDSSKTTLSISAKAIWHYFTSRADWQILKGWIRAMTGHEVSHGNFLISVGDELLVCQDKIVFPHLTCDVYSEFPGCPGAIKDIVVDELTRHGFYTSEQLSNLSTLLHHLGRTHTLFTNPHPLANLEQDVAPSSDHNADIMGPSRDHHGDDMEQSSAHHQIMSLRNFHGKFIEYCIKMEFVNVLYYYLDFYRLGESIVDVNELKLNEGQPAWVDMMVSFRLAGIRPEDKDCAYCASFSNARFVFKSESFITVNDMLREGRPVMALATLMYGPRPISQAIISTGEIPEHSKWQVDEELLRRSLSLFPKLLNAIFPVTTSMHGIEPQDITVYQLLQGNCQFEISRLFGWQRTNELARRAGNLCEMSHFSHAPTVTKYAHTEQLTFSYYLRHGRPSFAFNAFVVTHLKEPSISKTSLNIAAKKAYRIAIQNFTNTQITTSCVVFYEMLGIDSKGLRVDLMACNRILSHGGRDCMQAVDSNYGHTLQDKIVSELMSRRSTLQTTFLTALEKATSNAISGSCPDKTSFEASQHWTLVMDFCYVHKIDLNPQYLIDCAVADQWLPFVCFAQKWQFPKQQVLDVIENHFSNRHFKEHLKLAFENVQIITVEQGEESTKKKRRRRQTTKKEKTQVLTPTKDIRAQFYARMGLNKQGKDSLAGHQSSSEETDDKSKEQQLKGGDSGSATDGTVTAADESTGVKCSNDIHERPLDPDKLPDDFFEVLFACNDAKIPWRSLLAHAIALHRPLFAVLAACYEESKTIDCICAWMLSTYDFELFSSEVANDISETHWRQWTTSDLILMITILVSYKTTYAVTLAKAFYIFEPTNPMFHFLRFHESFVVHYDFENCRDELNLFKKTFSKLSVRESILSQADLTVTRELRWIEELTSQVSQQMVRQCDSTYELGHLLSLLAKALFGRNYACKTPNYYQLHKINEIVQDTKVVVDFSLLLDENSQDASKKKNRILEDLLHHKEFVKAREYARLLQLPEDPITLHEVQNEKERIESSVLWEIKQGRLAFWYKADKCFTDNRCNPEIAASFFEAQADNTELTYTEKSRLLSMTMKWYSKSSTNSEQLSEKMVDLERRIWLYCVRAEMEKNREVKFARSVSHLDFLPSSSDWATGFPVPFSDAPTGDVAEATELIQNEILDDERVTCTDLLTSDEEFSALDRVIGQLLDNCHVIQARRLAAHFGYTNRDLDIVLSCIFLSQGTRFSDTLEDSMKNLLHRTPHRRLSMSGNGSSTDGYRRSGSFVLSSSLSESVGAAGRADDSISVDWIQVEDTITAMETLMYYCKSGKKCCTQIMTCYKISQCLGLEYESIVTDRPFNVLHSLLVSGFDSRFKLAETYIKAFELNPNEVVGFLKDIILLSLRVYCGEELSSSSGDHELIFNAAPSCHDIIEVIKLCSDQALLGNRLLETAGSIADERISGNASDKALSLEVELLVRAHECHTMACNMEGITGVLKCGKLLTEAIAKAEKFPLMVRLLTGVGRYREMSYIFDTLLEYHYFELLFQRGLIDKENNLKVALLEYLKRSHPDDTEKFKMVAMRFSMHRELADRWKDTAFDQLNELKEQKISAKPELQAKLTSIMNSFKYATDYYKKDSCFKLSQMCLKHARLVQLQIHFLPLGISVINLDERGLRNFLAQHNHFFESLLVVDAYSKKGPSLWVKAVFNHVVINGDFKYWHELRSVMIPPSVLFVDVATKYKTSDNHSNQEIQNMKKLLTDLPELRVRYRIAADLGFKDMTTTMMEGEGGAYLKDVLGLI